MTQPGPAALFKVVAAAPRRTLRGRFWHQGSPRRPIESFADPARSDGRYHRYSGPGVWYASNQEQAAWAELFRHFTDEGIDPFEVLRRVGAADVEDLQVLDLTDSSVLDGFGLDPRTLSARTTTAPGVWPTRPGRPASKDCSPPPLRSPAARHSSCPRPASTGSPSDRHGSANHHPA